MAEEEIRGGDQKVSGSHQVAYLSCSCPLDRRIHALQLLDVRRCLPGFDNPNLLLQVGAENIILLARLDIPLPPDSYILRLGADPCFHSLEVFFENK